MAHSSDVVLDELTVVFGDTVAVDAVSLRVHSEEFVTLLGPSGCGKTTTLRCIAGLEHPTGGQVLFGDKVVAAAGRGRAVPPHVRRVGMVFQNYALWPHMTVGETIAFPMRTARKPRREVARRVEELLAVVSLQGLGDRSVSSLSGGQQQRVSLARALANESPVVLYDEPLSNLDAKLRRTMRGEIRTVHERMGTTSIFVTHDQEEALALSDRVVVMNHGRVEQAGSPTEIYNRPGSRFVADFMGFENILTADSCATWTDGQPGHELVALLRSVLRSAPAGGCVAFRGDRLKLGPVSDAGSGWEVEVVSTSYTGDTVSLTVTAAELTLVATVHGDEAVTWSAVRPGQRFRAHLEEPDILALPAQGGAG